MILLDEIVMKATTSRSEKGRREKREERASSIEFWVY